MVVGDYARSERTPIMTREQAQRDGYVECDNCGHAIEEHILSGCLELGTKCPCEESWTTQQIMAARRRNGLSGKF